MRSKTERRMRHATTLKTQTGQIKNKGLNRVAIHRVKGKVYKKTVVGGVNYYTKLSTTTD